MREDGDDIERIPRRSNILDIAVEHDAVIDAARSGAGARFGQIDPVAINRKNEPLVRREQLDQVEKVENTLLRNDAAHEADRETRCRAQIGRWRFRANHHAVVDHVERLGTDRAGRDQGAADRMRNRDVSLGKPALQPPRQALFPREFIVAIDMGMRDPALRAAERDQARRPDRLAMGVHDRAARAEQRHQQTQWRNRPGNAPRHRAQPIIVCDRPNTLAAPQAQHRHLSALGNLLPCEHWDERLNPAPRFRRYDVQNRAIRRHRTPQR